MVFGLPGLTFWFGNPASMPSSRPSDRFRHGADRQIFEEKVFKHHLGVEPKIGGNTPKWMVKIMENPIKMDDLGVPLFFETPI